MAKLGLPPATQSSATPVQVAGLADVVDIGIGSHHACALQSSGWVRCWGAASMGELGPGAQLHFSQVPLPVTGF
jgi:hypothetical protein